MNTYLTWKDVKKLHLEISALCNAQCPMCPRYIGEEYIEHPFINKNMRWTIKDTKNFLPHEYLNNIEVILFNGNFGDFITNNEALEITNHLASAPKKPYIVINTNGSARTSKWWEDLAKVTKKMQVNFAIDGLQDTHSIYRRNTNWESIIQNAESFMRAGGKANWILTVFEHNKHQIDDCINLSKKLGFNKIEIRNNTRKSKSVNFNNKIVVIRGPNIKDYPKVEELIPNETSYKNLINSDPTMFDNIINPPLPKLENCVSLRENHVYIDASWNVLPCCWIGRPILNGQYETGADRQLFAAANKQNLKIFEYIKITSDRPICQIVNEGFSWIYSNLLSKNILDICVSACHTSGALQTQKTMTKQLEFNKN